jgi:NHL repeat
MRVSLRHPSQINPRPGRISAEPCPLPLPMLSAEGPRVILGGHQGSDGLAVPVQPRARTLFGPRGACLASKAGPLFVADTGHHRLMIWPTCPDTDERPAEMLIGQPDFGSEGRNAKGAVGAATLNVPTGVAAADGVLAVADAWNHRVLIWHDFPRTSNQPADIVLGQVDFADGLANRGADAPGADTLNWCYGVTIADGRLFIADTGNRRVLMWSRMPERNGAPADLVLGQADFACRDENAGHGIGASGMRWPHSIVLAGRALMIADAGNNRIMVWRSIPEVNGAACDFVLGQAGVTHQEYNAAAYYPTAATVNMPYGLARLGIHLVVADTANSRLIAFDADRLAMGAAATRLTGQHRFSDKGDNRWAPPCRDSLCWPYGISACGRHLVIADSGNNRVMLWETAL